MRPEANRKLNQGFHGSVSYPPELFNTAHWYACRTRARAEKAVHRSFEEQGFESYLPLVYQERQWADRKKRVAFPLFPGYVFARFTLRDTTEILRPPGVANIAQPSGYPTPVRDEELESVRRLVDGVNEKGVLPTTEDYPEAGEEVEVISGPFRGMRGTLSEVRGRSRVCLRLWPIRHAVGVDIPRSMVRSVPDGLRRPSAPISVGTLRCTSQRRW